MATALASLGLIALTAAVVLRVSLPPREAAPQAPAPVAEPRAAGAAGSARAAVAEALAAGAEEIEVPWDVLVGGEPVDEPPRVLSTLRLVLTAAVIGIVVGVGALLSIRGIVLLLRRIADVS